MKHLTILTTTLTLFFAEPLHAKSGFDKDQAMPHAKQILQSGDLHISVNGLVCDFCARALEKVFSKQDEVKQIDVNLDTKIITVNFNDGQTLSDKKVKQLVTDAGYNIEGIHRVE